MSLMRMTCNVFSRPHAPVRRPDPEDIGSPVPDRLRARVVALEASEPDTLPQACFDMLAATFDACPDLLADAFDACCERSSWPGSRDPAFCRMSLLSAMLALMPGRPSQTRLAQAQSQDPLSSVAQCRVLQQALRLTIGTLRIVRARHGGDVAQAALLKAVWSGHDPRYTSWQPSGTTVASHRLSLCRTLAEARLYRQMSDVEYFAEIAEAGGWRAAHRAQVDDMFRAMGLSMRLIAWCTGALGG